MYDNYLQQVNEYEVATLYTYLKEQNNNNATY